MAKKAKKFRFEERSRYGRGILSVVVSAVSVEEKYAESVRRMTRTMSERISCAFTVFPPFYY